VVRVITLSPSQRGAYEPASCLRGSVVDTPSARKPRRSRRGGCHTENRFTEENWAVLDAVREVAADVDATPAQVSLAWLLHKDVVDAPIVGPRTGEHLRENLRAVELDLTDEQVERIEAPKTPRWPAPGKD
jgi:aryl-alcohol dehydrogenase-like predicted oxidoreductase